MRTSTKADLDRLESIREEMEELNNEALELVTGTSEEHRSRAYWVMHIRHALSVGWAKDTLKHTIERLREEITNGS